MGVGLLGAPPQTAIARLCFIALLGGAIVASLAALGRGASLAAGVLFLLTIGQALVGRPVPSPPSSQWTAELRTPVERLRHTIALPLRSREWDALWTRAHGAAVYVCARGPLSAADAFDLYAGGEHLARITQEHAFGPRPQPTSVGFYRVPIERSRLEALAPLVLELRRGPEATARPVEVCGTFTHRPSAGIESSAFFDGSTWRSPGPVTLGRYIVELRLEVQPGQVVAAFY
jgi:hypothetical protein